MLLYGKKDLSKSKENLFSKGSPAYAATDLLKMLSTVRFQRFPVMDSLLSSKLTENHYNKQ